jgi:hypothetical protein
MGYRSEVAYLIRFRDKHLRNTFVELILAKGDEHLTAALNHCLVDPEDNTICFYAAHWKWYESYPEVKAHNEMMRWAKELYEDDCDYTFTRVGENNDDIETDMSGGDLVTYDDVEPSTTIEISFNQDYTPYGGEEFKP